MDIRTTNTSQDITRAIALTERIIGSCEKTEYLASIVERGEFIIATQHGNLLGFCCLDHFYFFNKPFVSLLLVNPQVQRQGVGRNLLSFVWENVLEELWTSTNQSNAPMRALLAELKWQQQGTLSGLDDGDPELFYLKTR